MFRRTRRKILLCLFENASQIPQRFHLLSGKRINDRKIVCRAGESDLAVLALGLYRFVEFGFGLRHIFDSAIYGAGTNQLRH